MRYSPQSKSQRSAAGFTLIEMLVIAPVVLLTISGFIVLMVSMVGDVLTTRDQNRMAFDAQNALNAIEQDTRLSLQFLTTTSGVVSPQGTGSNFNGAGEFTNSSNILIFKTLATSKNPADPTRQLVYYANQPNICGPSQAANRLFVMTVVYFIKDGSLWRRTIVPTHNTLASPDANTTCDTPWQQNSCSPGYSAARCQTNDVELMPHVESVAAKYYASPGSTTEISASNANIANTIDVTITGQKDTAGNGISTSQSIVATKLNDAPQDTTGPTVFAFKQQPLSQSVVQNTPSVSFAASVNYSSATKQWQRSTDGGTTWSNISGATSELLTINSPSLSMNNYRYRMVATNTGVTITSAPAILTVTLWKDFNLQNDWENFQVSGDGTAKFTRTSAGLVVVKGLIKGGTISPYGTLFATLPEGFRPAGRMIMSTSTYTSGQPSSSGNGRIDILPNGEMYVISGSNDWFAINVAFMPGDTSYTWHDYTSFSNGWSSFGSGYEPLRSTVDNVGRVALQGLARPGGTANDTVITLAPTAHRPSGSLHFQGGHEAFGAFLINGSGNIQKRGSEGVGFLGLNAIYYPAAKTGWSALSLQNSWANYGSGFTDSRYVKAADGVVTVQGLVRSGTTTPGTVIANLPAGYRPAHRIIMNVYTYNRYGRVDIMPNGDIVARSVDSTWLALNNLSFVAEQ